MKPTIILDCDPGLDDAIAILCAHRYGTLAAITTVNGNVTVDKTTRNALLVAQIADIDVPVHRGAGRPLVAPMSDAAHVHGESGLDGPTLPPLERATASDDAVGFLLDTSREIDELRLIATGPLTNIALAIQQDSTFVRRLADLTVMGGSAGPGNVTAAAEFNTWADPEAAAIVFASGANLRMVGLDITHQVRMGAAAGRRLRAADTTTGTFVADLVDYYTATTDHKDLSGGAAIHDACAVLSVTHPNLFGGLDRHVVVELAGEHTRGMTVVDQRVGTDAPSNAHVFFDVDAPAVVDRIVEAAADPHTR